MGAGSQGLWVRAAEEVGAVADQGGSKGSRPSAEDGLTQSIRVLNQTGGLFGLDTEGSLRTKVNKLDISVTRCC